jgi:hypothetical protein
MSNTGRERVMQSPARGHIARTRARQAPEQATGVKTNARAGRKPVRQSPRASNTRK